MALSVSYTIEIGTPFSTVDFTDRTLGFSARNAAPLSDISPGTAFLTFDNRDGELTPGGNGTYANTDWFGQVVYIYATVVGTSSLAPVVFNGFIVDFSVDDNGTDSVVNISCQDATIFLGSTPTNEIYTLATDLVDAIEDVIAKAPYLPTLGGTATTRFEEQAAMGENPAATIDASNSTFGTLGDILRTIVMSSYPCAMWMGRIRKDSPLGTVVRFEHYDLGPTLTRPTSGTFQTQRQQLELNDGQATGTNAGIKFERLVRGFNNEQLINAVSLKTTATGNTSDVVDTTSANAYGIKALTIGTATNTTDALAEDAAQNMLNRRSTSRYVCKQLTTSTALIEQAHGDADWTAFYLLDTSTSLWQTANITFTPTGGNEIEELSVIVGRTIQATPANTSITLDLLPAVDFQSFVLNSSALGVLDENRLG